AGAAASSLGWFGTPKLVVTITLAGVLALDPASEGERSGDEHLVTSFAGEPPLQWPVHTAAELAAVQQPGAPSVDLAYILALGVAAVALALTSVVVIRFRRRSSRLRGGTGGLGDRMVSPP